jgi:hypothetical protein
MNTERRTAASSSGSPNATNEQQAASSKSRIAPFATFAAGDKPAIWTCLLCGVEVKTVMCRACARKTVENALGLIPEKRQKSANENKLSHRWR